MRVDSRIDANQPEIVAALRNAGCQVQHLYTIGHGCPDLLVGIPGVGLAVLEVKRPRKGLTPDEIAWHQQWAGFPVHIVRSPDEALAACGLKRGSV